MTRDPQRDKHGRFVGRTRAPAVGEDIAIVIVELVRETGAVTVIDTFSTPAETFAMLVRALHEAEDKFNSEEYP